MDLGNQILVEVLESGRDGQVGQVLEGVAGELLEDKVLDQQGLEQGEMVAVEPEKILLTKLKMP